MRTLLQYAEVTVQTEPMVFPEYASTHETSAGKKSSLSYTFGFPFWFSKSPYRVYWTLRISFEDHYFPRKIWGKPSCILFGLYLRESLQALQQENPLH